MNRHDVHEMLQTPSLNRVRKKDLQEMAEKYGLSTDGVRADIQQRIRDHLQSLQESDDPTSLNRRTVRSRSKTPEDQKDTAPEQSAAAMRTPRHRRIDTSTPTTPLSQIRQSINKVTSLLKEQKDQMEEEVSSDLLSSAKRTAKAFHDALVTSVGRNLPDDPVSTVALSPTGQGHRGGLEAITEDEETLGDKLLLSASRRICSAAATPVKSLLGKRSSIDNGECCLTECLHKTQARLFSTPRRVLTFFLALEAAVLLVQSVPLMPVTVGPWFFYTTQRPMPAKQLWVPDYHVFSQCSFWTYVCTWLLSMVALPYVLSVVLRPGTASSAQISSGSTGNGHRPTTRALTKARQAETSPFSVHPLSFAVARFALILLFSDPSLSSLSQPMVDHPEGVGEVVTLLQRALNGCALTYTNSWSTSAVCYASSYIQHLYQVIPKNVLLLTAIATTVFTFYDILERRSL
ncbi:hypothetical protein H4R34_000943 [Dimargaris verticillata]|uniref:SAP domain-containing protein n=1 Tax=Dimargaris verticillata TaxID=2761393 RepID=A0A9W8B6A6_9FUNG|nr:hypothetical protein H4R34_000943 [Dimargaris verticillata]